MATAPVLDREEYVEQAYFFRAVRERLADNLPAQDILTRVHEELLSSTRLPYAIQFLASELKHSGLLASGFEKLPHYFAPFQGFVVRQAEEETKRFPMATALLVLEREALYRADTPTLPGLFVYQFETIARNRLGYIDGTTAVAGDPLYDERWKTDIGTLPRQVGDIEFAELLYLRSARPGTRRAAVVRAVVAAARRRKGDRQGQPRRDAYLSRLQRLATEVPPRNRRRQDAMGEDRDETARTGSAAWPRSFARQHRPQPVWKPVFCWTSSYRPDLDGVHFN